MGLSREQRDALRARAAGLRQEVQSLVAERDVAVADATEAVRDVQLLAEVEQLERQAEDAKASRDTALGTVDNAIALMEHAARQQEVLQDTDPTGESTPLPATDDTTPDVVIEEDAASQGNVKRGSRTSGSGDSKGTEVS